jgi:sirohydrochlorin cobaltochelatase
LSDHFLGDDCTGVLLVGHGTRSEAGTAQFLALAEHLKNSLAPAATEPAFLELQSPDIAAAIERLLARKIERLVTVPLLLFTAGHAKQDIPRTVEETLVRHQAAHMPRWQTAAFGCHAALVRLSNLRLAEARLSSRATSPAGADESPPVSIVVGRGSRDDSATAEMHQFAHHKAAALPGRKFEVAFAALAEPLLPATLSRIAASGPAQVIVQPHLLFAGELVDRIERQTADAAARWPAIEWLVAPVLAGRQAADSTHFPHLEQVIRDSIVAAVSQK